MNLLKHKAYVQYCCDSTAIQDYWRVPEYVVYPINTAMQQAVPVVTSHINPGDIFNLGNSNVVQLGMVTRKFTIVQSGLDPERWKPSPQKPGGNYLEYEIAGDIGGFWREQPHKEMSSGFFSWIPLPCQLIAAGFINETQELQAILLEIASSKKHWKDSWPEPVAAVDSE